MTRLGRIREPASELTVADAAAALRQPGCPVCRYVVRSEDKFFTWFALENYGELPTLLRLRAAAGMCPPHTRRLIGEPGAASRVTTVYRQVLPAARALLDADRPDLAPCPACQSRVGAARHALTTLLTGLRDAQVARDYAQADGLCLGHLTMALPVDAARGRLLVGTALDRLAPGTRDLGMVAGWDGDAPARARLRVVLPAEDHPGAHEDRRDTTLDRIRARLAIDACPLCLVAGQAEYRYLRWLCACHAAYGPDSLRSQPGGLCPAHLHDLALLDRDTLGWAVEMTRGQRTAALTRVLHRLQDVPPRGLRGRWRHARTAAAAGDRTERRPSFMGELLASRAARTAAAYTPLRGEECMVCHAVAAQTRGETDLLLAALDLPAVARQYEQSHGLCLHHVLQLPRTDSPAGLARRLAAMQARLLEAELSEADRKQAWLARHEAAGPETSAWLRAPGFLHGGVFLGAPAQTW